MTEQKFAPRFEDGEPLCSGEECPHYAACEWDCFSYCPPGLRAQRDALQAERDVSRRLYCAYRGAAQGDSKRFAPIIAYELGWAGLYEKEGTK